MTRDILFVKLEHPFESFIVFAQNDEISKLMTFKTVVICKTKIKDLKKIQTSQSMWHQDISSHLK